MTKLFVESEEDQEGKNLHAAWTHYGKMDSFEKIDHGQ
jgi:hypothetical protein